MENCVAPGLDEFDVLLEVVLSFSQSNRSLTFPKLPLPMTFRNSKSLGLTLKNIGIRF